MSAPLKSTGESTGESIGEALDESMDDSGAATEMLRRSITRFGEREVRPLVASFDHGGALPASVVKAMDDLGLLSLGVDTREDRRLLLVSLEALAFEAAAPAALVLAHVTARSIREAAGVARPSSEGEVELLGYPLYADLVDPVEASEGLVLDDDLVLSGRVEMVVNAPIARAVVVSARRKSDAQVVLVLVETEVAGVRRGAPIRTLGMRGCPTCDLEFASVSVAPGQVLPGPREPRVAQVLRRLAGAALGIGCGVVRSSLGAAVDYARERYQGGSKILEHHQVRAMLAEMIADHATCLAAADVAGRADDPEGEGTGASRSLAAALVLRARAAAVGAASEGVQVFGGYGYMEDFGQERRLRDARQAASFFGRADVERLALVDEWLGAGAPVARPRAEE